MMTQQIQKKKRKQKQIVISPELRNALNELLVDFEKLQPKVDRVFEIGRLEGLKDKQIGKLVKEKMINHYSSDTVWRVFRDYPDAIFRRSVIRKSDKNDQQTEDKKETKSDNTESDEELESQGIGTKETEPNAIFYFRAEDFNINEVAEKDRAYLIDAVEYFYTKNLKLESEIAKLQTKKPKQKEKGSDAEKLALGEKMLKLQRDRIAGEESK